MRRILLSLTAVTAAIALLTLTTPPTHAQVPAPADAASLVRGFDAYQMMRRASPYQTASWSFLGPTNISGRSTDVAVADRAGQRRIYAAYATGGVWKSDDNGASWQVVFETAPSTSIGDIAVAPSNPDIVWVGTGEANILRASMPGAGIYKSTDAGRTWRHLGLADTQTIARIVVHPTNPDIVYVAASGHEWTDNTMRGVFKTTNGGRTWTKVYYRSPRTGAIDLVMDPGNPNILYAALWERIRRKWSDPRVEPGDSESGIVKTTDGGRTWKDASRGLPPPQVRGRIGLDLSRSNPRILYALVDNSETGRQAKPGELDAYGRPMASGSGFIKGADIYRSDDAGATWRETSRYDAATTAYLDNHSGTYGWVFGQIRVDPTNPDTVYSLGLALNVSHDGGRTFTPLGGLHGDHHGLWIDPANPSILYSCNDGGVFLSADGGRTWTFAVGAHATQFYNVALDTANPFHAYGSIQDIGSQRAAVVLGPDRQAGAVAWEDAPGGEGSNQAIDPSNPNIVYSHSFYGAFTRTDLGTQGQAAVTPIKPPDPDGQLRGQWMAPIVLSPHDARVVYAGYQYLFRSSDRGDTWKKISTDLSDDNPARFGQNPSAIPYQTIVEIAESPLKQGLLYVGTDDGRLHTTIDDGSEWTDLTSHLPVRKWISRIVPSRFAEGTVYVTQRGREDDDFAPYVYKSTDFGKTFTSIAANLPAGSVNVIREDPRRAGILYVGTDFGVYVSTDGGQRWEVLGGNLPSVQVSDLQYQARDNVLVAATYGRGMWLFDTLAIPVER
jgi:photosystem II stability/assembly factor-like uncharacterized protein